MSKLKKNSLLKFHKEGVEYESDLIEYQSDESEMAEGVSHKLKDMFNH